MQIDHVNLVVENLEAMTAFYVNVLGLKLTKRATITGEWISPGVGLPDAHPDLVCLDCPAGPRRELLQYNRPALHRPPNVDLPSAPGIRHLAFKIDDIDAAAARLHLAGVKLFSDVQTVPDTQVTYAGGIRKRLVYFQDPEGNLLELCEYKPQ